jgi:hypothetical protein
MIQSMPPQTAEQLARWLGETKGFWVQTGALFLSAIGALWIVFSRSRSERRRATVDLVLHQMKDEDLVKAMHVFFSIYGQGNLARFASQAESSEYTAIIKILNTYEFVAGGIREKAYDENIYKRMRCSTTIRVWTALSGFVEDFRALRELQDQTPYRKTFYQDFEWIAKKWIKDPLKPSA